MKWKNPEFDEIEDAFVGESWQEELARRWRGARAIVLYEVRDQQKRSGFSSFQRIELQKAPRSDEPASDITEALELIARSIHGKLTQRVEEGAFAPDDTVIFRVEVVRDPSKGDPMRASRTFFFVQYNLSEEPEALGNAETVQESYIRQCEFLVSNAMSAFDNAMSHCSNANAQILEMAKINLGPVEASGEALRMASEMQRQGYQAVLYGHQLQYAEDKARADANARIESARIWSDRFATTLENVAPLLPMVLEFVGKKMGKTPPKAGSAPKAPPEEPPKEPEPEDPESLLDLLNAFGESLAEEQMVSIRDTLTKSEAVLFIALLESESEEEVVERYRAFIGALEDMSAIMELSSALTPQQQGLLVKFLGVVQGAVDDEDSAGGNDESAGGTSEDV